MDGRGGLVKFWYEFIIPDHHSRFPDTTGHSNNSPDNSYPWQTLLYNYMLSKNGFIGPKSSDPPANIFSAEVESHRLSTRNTTHFEPISTTSQSPRHKDMYTNEEIYEHKFNHSEESSTVFSSKIKYPTFKNISYIQSTGSVQGEKSIQEEDVPVFVPDQHHSHIDHKEEEEGKFSVAHSTR